MLIFYNAKFADESTPIDYLVFVVPGINSGKGDQYTFDCS